MRVNPKTINHSGVYIYNHWIRRDLFKTTSICCSPSSIYIGGNFQSSPVQSSPVQSSPVQSSPVQSSPVQSSPVQSSPVQSSPVQSSPVQSSPVQSSPVQSSPVQSSPVQSSPVSSQSILEPEQLSSLDVKEKLEMEAAERVWRQSKRLNATIVPILFDPKILTRKKRGCIP